MVEQVKSPMGTHVTFSCSSAKCFGQGFGEFEIEYEILDKNGNFLYLTLSEARDYLQNLIADSEQD